MKCPKSASQLAHMTNWYKFTLTIQNGSAAAYDPVLLTTTLVTGETEAVEVYDLNAARPTTKVPPGHAIKIPHYYAGTPGALTVQASLGIAADNITTYEVTIWHD